MASCRPCSLHRASRRWPARNSTMLVPPALSGIVHGGKSQIVRGIHIGAGLQKSLIASSGSPLLAALESCLHLRPMELRVRPRPSTASNGRSVATEGFAPFCIRSRIAGRSVAFVARNSGVAPAITLMSPCASRGGIFFVYALFGFGAAIQQHFDDIHASQSLSLSGGFGPVLVKREIAHFDGQIQRTVVYVRRLFQSAFRQNRNDR